jgi:hypothetical protein
MSAEKEFIDRTYKDLCETIFNIDTQLITDIYVLSFWKYNNDDDPRQPVISVSYNTVSNVEKNLSRASGEAEAKWNFAYWLQKEETCIEGNNFGLRAWIIQLPFYYSDEDESNDFDRTFELGEKIQEKFMDIIIELSRRLHSEGIIKTKFKKEIPIIIHELEYYDLPLSWTLQGNPNGLASEFEKWVNQMGLH